MLDIASATNVDNSTTRKPCICIFSALYEPHVGGVESYTKGIAEALVTAGCRVIVVVLPGWVRFYGTGLAIYW